MIEGSNICLWVHNRQKRILDALSFSMQKAEVTVLMGKSGAGKTTLLRCCGGLNDQFEGQLLLNGKNIRSYTSSTRAHVVGFVFQQFNLFPHMDVLHNCMAPLLYEGKISRSQAQIVAGEMLAHVGMKEFTHYPISRLSGGQQQRVAVARALCLQPQAILFDEPTSALDPASTQMLVALFQQLKKDGITVGCASHDMRFIAKVYDIIYFLEDGKLIEMADVPVDQLAPHSYIAQFLRDG